MKIKKGFTLIELLVVISIIALLLSVVLPSMSKVKEKGRAAVCLANQRSIILGSMAYSVDNDGYYPASILGLSSSGVDTSKPYSYNFDLRSLNVFYDSSAGHNIRKPTGVGLLLGNGFNVEGKFFHCPSLKTKNAVNPYTGESLMGHGMDLSLEEGAATPWLGVGASCWNNPDADPYRIVTSYAYRSASWSQVNGKQLRNGNVKSSLIFYMDVCDPRFGITYAHKNGLCATFADGSGSFLKVDFEDIIEWVRPIGYMDGITAPGNDEIVFTNLERGWVN